MFGCKIIILEEDTVLPEDGTYYVVAGNGVFLHKDTPFLKGLTPVKSVSFLEDLKIVGPTWKGPTIPAEVGYKIKRFFYKVFQLHHSEANTILYYNEELNDWKVVVPVQTVSHGGVKYVREALSHLDNYIPIGTIHSHSNFGAFHSGTDDHDEETFDGIHITFGHNDQEQISISASVVMNGLRSMLIPEVVLEGFTKVINVSSDSFTPVDRYVSAIPDVERIAPIEDEVNKWLENVTSNGR